MHGLSTPGTDRATNPHGKTVSQKSDKSLENCADDRFAEGWFSRLVRTLFDHKPGTALHCITGVDERSCQRYAAGHIRPPGDFIRLLLRSDEGWQFLSGIMDGSDARWWGEIVRAKRLAEIIDREA